MSVRGKDAAWQLLILLLLAMVALAFMSLVSCGEAAGPGGPGVPTGSATLTWTAPNGYAGGSTQPLGTLSGYRIFYGEAPGSYTASFNVGNTTSTIVDDLDFEKEYYFALKAIDFRGNASAFSTEVSTIIDTQ